MRYAEVSVNSPAAQRRTFSYAIPQSLNIEIGQAVLVPFGDKLLQGIVLEFSQFPAVEETRDIDSVIDSHPLLSPHHVSLAQWISDYYLSPLFDAVALMLPPGFERRIIISICPTPAEYDASSLTQQQRHILELTKQRDKVGLRDVEKALGKKQAQSIVSQLVRRGLVVREYQLEPIRVKPKEEIYLSLAVSDDEAKYEVAGLYKRGASKQATLLDFLAQQSEAIPLAKARQIVRADRAVADALVNKGLVSIKRVEVKREPFSYQGISPSQPLSLTAAQESAFKSIQASMLEAVDERNSQRVFLLHGVTGSGKTEIYMQALAETIRLGKRGIVLVPEISLTPQTIERFASRFPNRVAVLHSQLSGHWCQERRLCSPARPGSDSN
jgi:primosomal protein N' (replication factor Y)